MTKTIFEKMGCIYKMRDDYLIPCLTLPPKKEEPIGLFGRRHLQYLKLYRRVTYTNLLTNGELNTYLYDIDMQANERFYRIVEQMKQNQNITEKLKLDTPMEWVRRMNAIRNQAEEIVSVEIIYQ